MHTWHCICRLPHIRPGIFFPEFLYKLKSHCIQPSQNLLTFLDPSQNFHVYFLLIYSIFPSEIIRSSLCIFPSYLFRYVYNLLRICIFPSDYMRRSPCPFLTQDSISFQKKQWFFIIQCKFFHIVIKLNLLCTVSNSCLHSIKH